MDDFDKKVMQILKLPLEVETELEKVLKLPDI